MSYIGILYIAWFFPKDPTVYGAAGVAVDHISLRPQRFSEITYQLWLVVNSDVFL